MSEELAIPGSARILRAGEGILPSRISVQGSSTIGAASNKYRCDPSSSPQNAATSTLQACAPQLL
jgi:hypothetical protein